MHSEFVEQDTRFGPHKVQRAYKILANDNSTQAIFSTAGGAASHPPMIGKALPVAALTLVCLVFCQALTHKLRDPARFIQSIREYRLLPGALAIPLGVVLTLAELAIVVLIAAALVVPGFGYEQTARFGLAFACVLLAIYAVAMGINLARSQFDLDCGCTSGQTPISAGLVARNFGLATIALGAVLFSDFAPGGADLGGDGGGLLGVPCGMALFLGYLTLTQLMSNRLSSAVLGSAR